MTVEELKRAFFERCPVMAYCDMLYKDMEYLYISALIYRIGDDGKPYVTAELMDKCRHAVIIAHPNKISFKETKEEAQ